MSHELISLDFGHVRETVGQWTREQESFETELAESLAALEAFQSNLDAWQRELADEREVLAREREARAAVERAADAEIAKLTQLVAAGKERITSLENDFLACNEELREAEEKRTEVISQLEAARTREKLLANASQSASAAATPKKKSSTPKKPQSDSESEQEGDSDPTSTDPQMADPVLNSVVAQFDKIRKQLAFGRQQSDSAE